MLKKQKEREELFQKEFEKWKIDETALQNWEDSDLHFFGAWGSLEMYRRLSPKRFTEKAHSLLKAALANLSSQFHLGGFLHGVVTSLLPDEPRTAWEYFSQLNSGALRISVSDQFDIPLFYDRLWDVSLCSSPDHTEMRIYLFEGCVNEFEIMVHTIAAISNNAHDELYGIIEKLLWSSLAKIRALAVSILAWIGEEKSNQILSELKAKDPSRWIRDHADWALEVGLQEKSARTQFIKTFSEADPLLVSAALQVLEPALTPVARWWYYHIRAEEEKKGTKLNRKVAGVMESFWHHRLHTHSSTVTVCGVRLDEYNRGERMDKLTTPRISPWWNP